MIDLVNETFGIPLAEKLTHFTSGLLHHRSGLSAKKLKLSRTLTAVARFLPPHYRLIIDGFVREGCVEPCRVCCERHGSLACWQ